MTKLASLAVLVTCFIIASPGRAEEMVAPDDAATLSEGSVADDLSNSGDAMSALADESPLAVMSTQVLWPTISPRSKASSRVGVRAAYHMTSAGEARDASAGALAGAFFRLENGHSRFSYEVGLDVYAGDENDGYRTQPLGARADILVSVGRGALLPYVNVGLAGIHEQVEDTLTGESFTNYAAAANLGAGIGLLGGRLDVRLVHSLFLASENVSGKTMLSVGYGF